MKITLEQAYKILKKSDGVDVNTDYTFPSMSELTGEDENEWMRIETDGYYKFAEGNNREIEVDGCTLFINDTEGETVMVQTMKYVDALSLI